MHVTKTYFELHKKEPNDSIVQSVLFNPNVNHCHITELPT